MDIMVFMLPSEEKGQLNEVMKEEKERGREGISKDVGMRRIERGKERS